MEAVTPDARREGPALQLDTGTRLAYERTFLAHERTQMAFLRTALSLISFGFTISKFFEFLHEKQGQAAPFFGARTVGILMIAIGLVSLIMGTYQHWRALAAMRAQCPDLPRSTSWVTALLMTILGVGAMVGALVR